MKYNRYIVTFKEFLNMGEKQFVASYLFGRRYNESAYHITSHTRLGISLFELNNHDNEHAFNVMTNSSTEILRFEDGNKLIVPMYRTKNKSDKKKELQKAHEVLLQMKEIQYHRVLEIDSIVIEEVVLEPVVNNATKLL